MVFIIAVVFLYLNYIRVHLCFISFRTGRVQLICMQTFYLDLIRQAEKKKREKLNGNIFIY